VINKYNFKCLPFKDVNTKSIQVLSLENIIEKLTNQLKLANQQLFWEKQHSDYLQLNLNDIKENIELSIKPNIKALVDNNKRLQRSICDRIATEAQLLQTTSELQEIFQAFPDVYIRVDIQGVIISYQGNINDIFWTENQTILGKNISDFLSVDIHQEFKQKIDHTLNTNLPNTFEYSISLSSLCKYFEARFFVSIPEQVIIIIRDITDMKESQISLQNAKNELEKRVEIRTHELNETNKILLQEINERNLIEKRYARAIYAGKIGAWEWNIQTDEIYIDANLKTMLGCSPDTEINDLNSWLKFIHPDDIALVKAELNACAEGLTSKYEVEHRIFNKNNDNIWFLARGNILKDIEGNFSFVVGSNTDITDKKVAENKLKKSLYEKEVLLKEIHHRVKNNLQIISSLLRLQAGYVNDKQSLNIFQDSQTRIRAMAMIHENLYQSDDLEKINFHDYISNLTTYISRCYGSKKKINVALDIEQVFLGIDHAICCGLIINELVSNSIKHAFVEKSEGNIYISFQRVDNQKYCLCVSDDGIASFDDSRIHLIQSMGLQLVWNLVEQLEGSISCNTKLGTLFTITFLENN
jgi:PAS domain S-box-containing protein